MIVKICLSILLLWTNVHESNGQFEFLNCNYFLQNATFYGCRLEIYNPNRFNNFTNIEGTHLSEKSDRDVKYITRNKIVSSSAYPSVICEKFKNIEKIEITYSIFEEIDENAFRNCTDLTYLDFGYNKINSLSDKLFRNSQKLTFLSLYNNKISEIGENTFENLQELTLLSLSYNPIERFPKNVFKPLINLARLNADYMNLKVLDSNSFGGHRFLTILSLIGNQINAFDERIIDNTAISTLDLRANLCINNQVNDATVLRNSMRSLLQICTRNFRTLTTSKLIIFILKIL